MLDDEQRWLVDTTEYYVADTLLELDRAVDVIQRWPDDTSRHTQVGSYLLRAHDQSAIDDFLKRTADTTNASLRVQRLRIEAAGAMRSDGGQRSDDLFQQAIQLAQSTYDEDHSFYLNFLLAERAENLVWNRIDVKAVSLDSLEQSHIEHLVSSAVEEAAKLCDTQLVSQWVQRIQELGIHEGDAYTRIQSTLGDFHLSQGDSTTAAEVLRNRLSAIEPSETWAYTRARDDLFGALIAASEWDEARELVGDIETDTTEVPPAVLIDLAMGDVTALRSKLDQLDKETVARWLTRSEVERHLVKSATEPWVTELLTDFPISMRFHMPTDYGELLLEHNAVVDERSIHSTMDRALKDTFSLTKISSSVTLGETNMWLATTDSGQRLLLSRSVREHETTGLNETLASTLSQPVIRLTIEMLDDRPQSTQRLFQLAAEFSKLSSISFSWTRESHTWTQPKLEEQLRWQGRVPVGAQVAHVTLETKATDATTSAESMSIEEWQRLREDANESIPVIATPMTLYGRERLAAELLSVDVDNYKITIQPKADSVINPLVKAGISCTVGPGDVEPVPASN